MSSAEAGAELGDDSCRTKYWIFMAATIAYKSIAALVDLILYVFVLRRLRRRLESESVTQRRPVFMKKERSPLLSSCFPFISLSFSVLPIKVYHVSLFPLPPLPHGYSCVYSFYSTLWTVVIRLSTANFATVMCSKRAVSEHVTLVHCLLLHCDQRLCKLMKWNWKYMW